MLLDLNEIKVKNKTDIDTETFEIILSKIHKRIKSLSKDHYDSCKIIPEQYVFGRPLYDYDKLINYLLRELSENGLKVKKHKTSNEIYISWNENDINMEKYVNKIHHNDNLSIINVKQKTTPQQTMIRVNNNDMVDYIPINYKKFNSKK